jgi:hypothetical protein
MCTATAALGWLFLVAVVLDGVVLDGDARHSPCSTLSRNTRGSYAVSSAAVTARAAAERGNPSRGPSSPKYCPGPRVASGERPRDAGRQHPRRRAERVDGVERFPVELLDEARGHEQQREHHRTEEGDDDEAHGAVAPGRAG